MIKNRQAHSFTELELNPRTWIFESLQLNFTFESIFKALKNRRAHSFIELGLNPRTWIFESLQLKFNFESIFETLKNLIGLDSSGTSKFGLLADYAQNR